MDCNEEFSHSVQQRLRLLAIAFPVYCDYNLFSSVDCSEEFSHHNSQVYDALATAAVITATVYYDNSQAIRLQFSSTSGLQRDQLKSSSQDNENCCVQLTVGCNGGIFYIVRAARASSKTIVKCFCCAGLLPTQQRVRLQRSVGL